MMVDLVTGSVIIEMKMQAISSYLLAFRGQSLSLLITRMSWQSLSSNIDTDQLIYWLSSGLLSHKIFAFLIYDKLTNKKAKCYSFLCVKQKVFICAFYFNLQFSMCKKCMVERKLCYLEKKLSLSCIILFFS